MQVKKYKLHEMLLKDHDELNKLCRFHRTNNLKIDIGDDTMDIESWEEHPHNGSPCNEYKFSIEIPLWLQEVMKDSIARRLNMGLKDINNAMKRNFEALIILNKLLEKKGV